MMKINNIDELYIGIVNDSMNTLGLTWESYFINIKPVAGYTKLIHGPAFTTYGEITNNEKLYSDLDKIRLEIYRPSNFKNNPIVALQANDDKVAHTGDITSQIYQKLGAAGFITDGCVRDTELIEKLKFPCFAIDSNPIDAINYWALIDFQTDIQIKGVKIKPNDYIFCSKDGVIVCPKEMKNDLENKMHDILAKEVKIRSKIRKTEPGELYNTLLDLLLTEGRW